MTNESSIDYLLSPEAIRQSCGKIYAASSKGLTHFEIREDQLPSLANEVIAVCRENYPDLQVPFHARARHFKVGNIDRMADFLSSLTRTDPAERCRKLIDLVVVSVLLDAGAGNTWTYYEDDVEATWSRSEGLAVASYHMFRQGLFSMRYQPEVSAEALMKLPLDSLAHGFQVSPKNPLTGLEGRLQLLNNLGQTLTTKQNFFPGSRPGGLLDFIQSAYGQSIEAKDLLKTVLLAFGEIWPGRYNYQGQALGDAWPHPLLAEQTFESERFVVFHKLSQWLTYSLVEPLESAGIKVENIADLTGLAEYRNGGLFLDGGVIALKDPGLAEEKHKIDSPLIVEWRALTVCLLDRLAEIIREKLDMDATQLPLVKVLEGGTWWTGRKLANQARPGGVPPLQLISDGTIF
ncbi:URC4/urg3 family protein [Pseudobacteriovorax antillogorgiicola]|uniref:Uracil phosphoribosyltransferase n=1 Tax=Pseudobacteriovorax antillogorgiicola TaxID=1513793 RepID=A0A1Y6CN03_9BACT|nr:URC4/urg3 family protein [Pseudobacteriovorax antillogorgiicola]TCS47356.1 uncharacterized protein DUF1688 [Pseudobacteriovorax antillogorgiicola]SMF63289.1 Protein of unknown function [Pseudobacteriovorax antillogorgiicola]